MAITTINSGGIKDGSITNVDISSSAAIAGSKLTGVDSLPSRTGHSGKYLTNNGTDASWSTISTVFPFFKSDGTSDTITITNGTFPFYKADGSADNIGVS